MIMSNVYNVEVFQTLLMCWAANSVPKFCSYLVQGCFMSFLFHNILLKSSVNFMTNVFILFPTIQNRRVSMLH